MQHTQLGHRTSITAFIFGNSPFRCRLTFVATVELVRTFTVQTQPSRSALASTTTANGHCPLGYASSANNTTSPTFRFSFGVFHFLFPSTSVSILVTTFSKRRWLGIDLDATHVCNTYHSFQTRLVVGWELDGDATGGSVLMGLSLLGYHYSASTVENSKCSSPLPSPFAAPRLSLTVLSSPNIRSVSLNGSFFLHHTYVGADYFGPVQVKQRRSTVKRCKDGCIFTCFSKRAVHIEVAHSLDTDSMLSALRRFISIRGYPDQITSDRGTNFVSADKELTKGMQQWDEDKIHVFCLQRKIQCMFNPSSSSHKGGVWEWWFTRSKSCLRQTSHELLS